MKRDSKPSAGDVEDVLFAVIGMSPAVLTETVWALAQERPAFIPHRVVVLTTSRGMEQIKQELFAGAKPVWDELRQALLAQGHALEGRLQFGDTADDLRVFTRADRKTGRTQTLNDIRTLEENNAVADFILAKLREFTENPQVRLVASIAGGRKTMGSLLYAAMSLLGREKDRLTHVLVSDPFDDARLRPKFYFTAQSTGELVTSEGKRIKAADARIDLADLPFVPLRNRFHDIAEMPGAFHQLITRCSTNLKQEANRKAVVKFTGDGVEINGQPVRLRQRAQQTLRFLLHVNQGALVPPGQPEAVEPMKQFLGIKESRWITDEDDLKRELSELRTCFKAAGILWGPGERRNSLRLPPFRVLK